jgi:hypothetical protein
MSLGLRSQQLAGCSDRHRRRVVEPCLGLETLVLEPLAIFKTNITVRGRVLSLLMLVVRKFAGPNRTLKCYTTSTLAHSSPSLTFHHRTASDFRRILHIALDNRKQILPTAPDATSPMVRFGSTEMACHISCFYCCHGCHICIVSSLAFRIFATT